MPAPALILAHQGGWDELLMILVPVAIFVGLLWLANNRAAAPGPDGRAPGDEPDPPTD